MHYISNVQRLILVMIYKRKTKIKVLNTMNQKLQIVQSTFLVSSRRDIDNFGKPLFQGSRQNRRQLFYITDNQVVRKREILQVSLHL